MRLDRPIHGNIFLNNRGVGVNEALKSGNARYIWKEIPDYQPNESLDFLYNKQIVDYFRDISKKYMVMQPDVKRDLEKAEKELREKNSGKRICGVLARVQTIQLCSHIFIRCSLQ